MSRFILSPFLIFSISAKVPGLEVAPEAGTQVQQEQHPQQGRTQRQPPSRSRALKAIPLPMCSMAGRTRLPPPGR